MHINKEIQFDEQLKCLKEKDMTISELEKSINAEKDNGDVSK